MKSELTEHGECFEVSFTPETIEEAATIIRMGMNGVKEVRSYSANVYKDHTISGYIVIGKRKSPRSNVAPGRW